MRREKVPHFFKRRNELPSLSLLHTREQLLTCVDVKLAINRLRVRLSGILAYAELARDSGDGAAANEFGEHVALPSRQAITLPDAGLMTNGIYDGEGQQMELWVGAAGQDTDFYKSPEKLIGITDGPFYGCSYKPMLLVVLGGTRTNIDLQALDANDEPIPGLFNVGTMIGDFYSGVYTFAMEGMNYGATCITLPYLLGRDLAAGKFDE